jgi:K+-sensing histidine kinase KdpD
LFKPFTKLESGKHLNPNGIGLGLSICKGILDKLGCDICVVSSDVKRVTNNNIYHGTSMAFSMPVFTELVSHVEKSELEFEKHIICPTSS